ncbi:MULTISPECIES: WxL domain-containing protein [Enterococcus]|uniref:WxL domain-containing protein n=1 Tax=Enterococcus alishanensis TaxID=1303817 RepID=A0ABS6TE15_9ENTE|nr:WxL domain-containing protein [Enterococcus alishanensis]MBV7391136.1 WxL domain-containing protein [Enterococcus alishanensis]
MKRTAKLLLASMALGAVVVAPISTFAADGGNYDSKGTITFQPGTDPTNPVDPTNPTNPVQPTDPTDPTGPKPGTNGPLSIDFASSFDFGTQKITSQDKTYNAQAQKYYEIDSDGKTSTTVKEGPNYVQVSDNRGTETGWSLNVTQDAQFTSSNSHVLEGAVITLNNGNVVSASKSAKPTGTTKVSLTPGAASTMMSAKLNEGAGTYLLDWGTDATTGAESVQLKVPGSTTKYAEKYNTTLKWALLDTPGN